MAAKKMPLWLTVSLVASGGYVVYLLVGNGSQAAPSGPTTPAPAAPQPPAPTGQAVYAPTGGQQLLNQIFSQ
jgi:hypothetical protein